MFSQCTSCREVITIFLSTRLAVPNSDKSMGIRVLYISHLHPPLNATLQNIGGMQTVSLQLLSALKNRSDIAVYPVLLESPMKGIAIRTIWFLLQLYRTIPSLAQREKIDVIVFSSMVTASLAILLRSKINIPMITINHGQDVTLPVVGYQQLVPHIFNNLNGVISVSAATREASLQRGLERSKSIIIPNGIGINESRAYDKKSARRLVEETFDMSLTGKHLLLSVGRQVKRKGHAWFIQAALPLIQHEVVYLLIGNGKEHNHLQHLQQRSQHPDQIILAGAVSTTLLQAAYDAADLFIMPNIPVSGDMEGFGVVILEANESRTPAIASDLEGIKDVIKNGINGYRVPPLDGSAFAQTIDNLFDRNLHALSESAYQHVTAYYSWNSISSQYVHFFQSQNSSKL
jgi:phosphatidylinositol alpha-1,6-mannosyltransferase